MNEVNMKEVKIESTLYVFDSIEEVSDDIQSLMKHAVNARKKAYAPYSKFSVGAAILLENGEVVIGNNRVPFPAANTIAFTNYSYLVSLETMFYIIGY